MLSTENLRPPSPGTPPGEKNFQAQLLEQIQSINRWNDLPEIKRKVAVEDFMEAIGRLYLDYYQFHLDEARNCSIKKKSTIESSFGFIITYISNLEHTLRTADAMEDPWETACRGRTNIEAFISMFDAPTDVIDSDGIESYMQDRKGNAQLRNSLIPKNVPSSHWWWFAKYS